jgi:glycosyltransferase involved in cell wall biosynthesis
MTQAPQATEISNTHALVHDPLVSVYMPAFKHERFIAEAIDGILAQQCGFQFELIIGEDCSPDGTKQIALDYQRRHPSIIRIITADRNVGTHANARRCQRAARGKFIAICEGDDYWHHTKKLQMQIDVMRTDPTITVCHTDYDRLTRHKRHRNYHRNHPSPWLARGSAYLALLHEWSVMSATSVYRADVFRRFWDTEFDNPNWPFGDRNRLLFASLMGPIGYIDVSTATYRKVRGSAVNAGFARKLRMELATEECIDLFLSQFPVLEDSARDVRARMRRRVYDAAFLARRIDLMKARFEWLQSEGANGSHAAYEMRRLAVRLKFPMWAYAARDFVRQNLSAFSP